MKKFLALSLSDEVFILVINVKTPTIAGILTFMSRINLELSRVEHEKSFIASSQDQTALGSSCLLQWQNCSGASLGIYSRCNK